MISCIYVESRTAVVAVRAQRQRVPRAIGRPDNACELSVVRHQFPAALIRILQAPMTSFQRQFGVIATPDRLRVTLANARPGFPS